MYLGNNVPIKVIHKVKVGRKTIIYFIIDFDLNSGIQNSAIHGPNLYIIS